MRVIRFKSEPHVLNSREIPPRLQPYTKKHIGTLVIDLTASSFIDSQWLAVFIRLHELSKQHKNTLYFCIPEGTIYDLFNATGLTSILNIVDSLDQIPK
jgi:anti-anti-sigma factor